MYHHFVKPLVMLVGASIVHGEELALFTDSLATQLKAGVTAEQVAGIKDANLRAAAEKMLKKEYDTAYRVASYTPLLKPSILGRELGIGDGYSHYEGVTGVVLPAGEATIIVEGLRPELAIGLLVPDWLRFPPDAKKPTEDSKGWGLHKKIYMLKNGVNHVKIDKEGLAYIGYFHDNPEKESPIKVHFVNGKQNGYFDISKHSNEDFDALLKKAQYPIFDAIGKHIQVAYPVAEFQKHAAGRGRELVENYDKMLDAQYEIMGLHKYNRVPKNRMLSRVNYNYYMFRDGDGVAYMGGPSGHAMHLVVNPDRVIKGDPCWGFNHEVGHAHQLRPFFNWGGLGEVSNNVFSLYGTMAMGNSSLLSQNKTYAKAKKQILDTGISYLECPDVFSRLVPFWQLQLYSVKHGDGDFYPDLFEALRKQAQELKGGGGWGSRQGNPAEYQINFIKKACIAAKTDLTDFFQKWGFLKVGEFNIGDYGSFKYVMTDEMVKACLDEIAAMNLPKPKVDLTTLQD